MSAEVVRAFEEEAHRLDAEADNRGADAGVRGEVQREIAQVLRNLAHRAQGNDPAAVAAAEQAGAGSGLAVERTDEAGNPVPAPPDAQR
jgi:hypothetical protein